MSLRDPEITLFENPALKSLCQNFENGNAEGVRQIQPRATPWVRRNALVYQRRRRSRDRDAEWRRYIDDGVFCELLQSSLFLYFALYPRALPWAEISERLRRWFHAVGPMFSQVSDTDSEKAGLNSRAARAALPTSLPVP